MKMHRLAALGAVAMFIAACGPGAGTPTQAPGTQAPATAGPTEAPVATITPPTTLITPGKLTDCVDIEYSPMEFFASADITDPNLAIGFDVDAARAVADALGLELEVKNTAFDSLIGDLQAGRCDIVWTALYLGADRLKVADGVGYMATGHVIMVPAGNPKAIKSADDLCGKTISIQSGGFVEKRANAASTACTTAGKAAITIQGYPKVADEFQQIVLGRVDAIWETDTAVSDWMIKNPDVYEVAYAFPRDDIYGVYYTKGATDLGAALTAALQALKADGTLGAIAGAYQIDEGTLEAIK